MTNFCKSFQDLSMYCSNIESLGYQILTEISQVLKATGVTNFCKSFQDLSMYCSNIESLGSLTKSLTMFYKYGRAKKNRQLRAEANRLEAQPK